MQIAKRMGKNLFYKLSTEGIARTASFLFYAMIARKLGESGLGTYNLLFSITAVLVFITDPGLNLALIKSAPRKKDYIEEYIGHILSLKIVLCLLMLLASLFYGWTIFSQKELLPLLIMMSAYMALFSLSEFAGAIFQAREEMYMESLFIGMGRIIVVSCAILALMMGYGLKGMLSFIVFAQLSVTMGSFFLTYKIGIPIRYEFQPKKWIIIFKEGLPLGIITFFTITYYRMDVIIAPNLHLSLGEIGIYSAGIKIIDVLLAIATLAMAAFFPTLSKIWKTDYVLFARWTNKIMALMLLLGIIVGSIIFIYSDKISIIVFGNAFVGTGKPLKLLGLAIPLMFLRHTSIHTLILEERPNIACLLTGIAILVNVLLNVLLTTSHGIIGMATAKLFTELFLFMTAGGFLYKSLYQFKINGR